MHFRGTHKPIARRTQVSNVSLNIRTPNCVWDFLQRLGFLWSQITDMLFILNLFNHRSGSYEQAGHAVCSEDEVKVVAEDGHEEQCHQADALQGPGDVLRVCLRWSPPSLHRCPCLRTSRSRIVWQPFCCYFSLYFISSDLIIKGRIVLALTCHFWTGLKGIFLQSEWCVYWT